MADINPIPLVACDCCGVQAKKESDPVLRGSWRKPAGWGHVRVSPTTWERYPNPIDLLDLCPECVKAIHKAVSEAIDKRKAASAGQNEIARA